MNNSTFKSSCDVDLTGSLYSPQPSPFVAALGDGDDLGIPVHAFTDEPDVSDLAEADRYRRATTITPLMEFAEEGPQACDLCGGSDEQIVIGGAEKACAACAFEGIADHHLFIKAEDPEPLTLTAYGVRSGSDSLITFN